MIDGHGCATAIAELCQVEGLEVEQEAGVVAPLLGGEDVPVREMGDSGE